MEDMLYIFGMVTVWVPTGVIAGLILAHRGHSPLFGIPVAILGGPLALILCLAWPMTPTRHSEWVAEKAAETAAASSKICPSCGRNCGGLATHCPRCGKAFLPNGTRESVEATDSRSPLSN